MKIAELYELYKQHPVVTTDSRKCPQGALFFALKGDSFNGNAFAAQALEQGCAYAIVDEVEYAVGATSITFSGRCTDGIATTGSLSPETI